MILRHALIAALMCPAVFAVTITAVADTYITEHAGLSGTGSNHGSELGLWEIGADSFRTFPLIRFDLSPFAGQTVSGSGTLTLNVVSTFSGLAVSQTVEVHAILVSWVEGTVTWNSFGPGPISGTNYDATALQTATLSVSPGSVVTYNNIPAATIQSWINTPASNFGILLLSTTNVNQQDIVFASRESTAAIGPQLTFNAVAAGVPEPANLATGGLALLGAILAVRRYRNSRVAASTSSSDGR